MSISAFPRIRETTAKIKLALIFEPNGNKPRESNIENLLVESP